MADKKKAVEEKVASKSEKANKATEKKEKKNIFKSIAKFFKDLRGEVKKIVWPGRQMVIKSTGVVLAAILVIGAGIWVLDYAIAGSIRGISKLANETEVTETVADDEDVEDADSEEAEGEETTEPTTAE
ncbi:MAG: preprotein translocase subunit SecE [Oscillospiraceae bacterium]|nr:preprotein translocase subunit SecE [Oscillospiraceae bacterium]